MSQKRLIQQRKEVTKMYNFRKTEKKWQDYWEENKTMFLFEKSGGLGEVYSSGY